MVRVNLSCDTPPPANNWAWHGMAWNTCACLAQKKIPRKKPALVNLDPAHHRLPPSRGHHTKILHVCLGLRLISSRRPRRLLVRTKRQHHSAPSLVPSCRVLSPRTPRLQASFSHPGDSRVTIEEAGLGKQALLFVEQKPAEAIPPPGATEETAAAAAAAAGGGDSSRIEPSS